MSPYTANKVAIEQFDEVYHLAAYTHVGDSFHNPAEVLQVNTVATTLLLEALRLHSPHTKFYFAATSEMLPTTMNEAQDEGARLGANSPYAASKVAAHLMCQNYRDAYNMFIVNGITFNSESPRRGADFVTQKLCQGVARVRYRGAAPVRLATLSPHRDWHHARDTVNAMYLAMQHPTPDTYVFASGESHSVNEWANLTAEYFGLQLDDCVRVDNTLKRPMDLLYLQGNPAKAERVLGWRRQYNFKELVEEMCAATSWTYTK